MAPGYALPVSEWTQFVLTPSTIEPRQGHVMTPEQLYAVIGSNVVAIAVVSGIVGTFFLRTVSRLDRRVDNDKAAADADRRAFSGGHGDVPGRNAALGRASVAPRGCGDPATDD